MAEKTTMRLELPQELNYLILAYKRALKRNTGVTKNKDQIILEVLNNNAAAIRQKVKKLDAEYNRKMAALKKVAK